MRQILVFGEKVMKITIPDDAKVTFGPWSPPRATGKGNDRYFGEPSDRRGTLRIYTGSKENVLAVFSGVTGFRDLSIGYAEQVAKEEGATLWKDDEQGYVREHKQQMKKEWVGDPLLEAPAVAKKGRRK